MRMIGYIVLALATPAFAQDATPDAADGYPLEAQYVDSSADLPRDGSVEVVLAKAKPTMWLDDKGQPARYTFLAMAPGQTLLFRIGDGKMTDVRLVDAGTVPKDGEIRATMESEGGTTTLQMLNKGPLAYNYTAAMTKSIDATDGQKASVCTLLPGISGFEMWPYPIASITIGAFTPAPDGQMVCK